MRRRHGIPTPAVLALATLLLMPLLSAWAADDAGVESPFSLGVGSRALGMGGAFSAIADDASTVYYNPAGLARTDYNEISLMYVDLFEGTNYSSVLWALPVSQRAGVGFGFMRIGTDEIVRREDGFTVGEFSFSQSQALLAFGWRSPWRISFGGTLKAVNQSFGDFSDWSLGGDLAALADLGHHLSAGIIARGLLEPDLRLDQNSERIPRSFAAGLALRDYNVFDHVDVTLGIDLEKQESRDARLHTGGEVLLLDRYAMRAGYDRDNLSLGAGLRYKGLSIDYAFRIIDYVDNSHRFTLSFRIGKSRMERFAPRGLPGAPPPRPLTEEEKRILALKQKANQFFHGLQLDSALVYFRQVLELEPEDEETQTTISSIENELEAKARQRRQLELAERELAQFAERYLAQAVQFKEKRYYAAAVDLLDLVIEVAPDKDTARVLKSEIARIIEDEIQRHREQAQLAHEAEQTVDAIGHYNSILELDPDNADARRLLEEARSGLNRTQRLQLAIELFNSGRLRQARQRFEVVLSDDPGNATAQEYVGNIDALLSETTTLEDLQRNPRVWQLYISGIRFMRNRQYQEAIRAFEQVLEAYPNNVDTQNNLEQARLRLQSESSE